MPVATLAAAGGSGAFSGQAGAPSDAAVAVTGNSGTFSGSASVSGAPVDVRVSWLAFDTAATPCDVRVSWLCHDTAATPCDVRVSWLSFDTAATQVPEPITKNYGIPSDKSTDWLRDERDDELRRIARQNKVILALVTAAVSQGLLV